MKHLKKFTSLILLISGLLISTLNATDLIEDMKVISGKLVYKKKVISEIIEINKVNRSSAKKDLSPLYIRDNQNNKYQIFSDQHDNMNDNRFLKLALLNHFKFTFIEDLHDKEINFIDISNDRLMRKIPSEHKQFILKYDNINMFLIPVVSKISPFNIIEEYQSSSSGLEKKIDVNNTIFEPNDLSVSNISQLIDEFENLTISDTNQIVEKPKTIIGRLSSWVMGD